MGATVVRTPGSSEEAKLLSVHAVLSHAEELAKNPKLLAQLISEAKASLEVTETLKGKQAQAIVDIRNGEAMREDLLRAHDALARQEAEITAKHEASLAGINAQAKKNQTEHDDKMAKIFAVQKDLLEASKKIETKNAQVESAKAELDKTRAQLAEQEKGLLGRVAEEKKKAQAEIDAKAIQLDKRERAIEAKASKIEAMKKALLDD